VRSRDLGLVLLLLVFATSKRARAPSSAPKPPVDPFNMSPEEQAERLPTGSIELLRGHHYRFEGTLSSAAPIDPEKLKAQFQTFTPARDVQIGARPPHRASWIATMPINWKLQLGSVFPVTPEVKVKIESVRELQSTEVMV